MDSEVTERRRAHAEVFGGNPITELVISALEKMPQLLGDVETKLKAPALVKMQCPNLDSVALGMLLYYVVHIEYRFQYGNSFLFLSTLSWV
jgi:hypothetical protein